MKFSRQEYQRALPFPSPGDSLNPEIEPGSPALQADSLLTEPPGKPRHTLVFYFNNISLNIVIPRLCPTCRSTYLGFLL